MTSGFGEENLGSDEHEIINICNVIIDVKLLKTVDLFNVYLTPQSKAFSLFAKEPIFSLKDYAEKNVIQNSMSLETFVNEVSF